MRSCLLFWIALFGLSSAACAQPTPCRTAPTDYSGSCYHGALPAFFDDFEYTSARTQGKVEGAPEGDLFSANTWHLRQGTEQTRAWYRFNRNDLPIPGTITFGHPSVMRMELPEGLPSRDYPRSSIINAEFAAEGGTYIWRARLSALWPGQSLRQTLWTMSNTSFVFDRPTASGTERATYWSELDFENENHFQGERRDGVFVPDYVTRMSVGNHYGALEEADGTRRRLSATGPVPGSRGRGKLARTGLARGDAARAAPLIPSWADQWLYFIIDVNESEQTATYRIVPEHASGALAAFEGEALAVGPDFYPFQPMHPAFSLHWVNPEGTLQQPLYLEADWFYYTPAGDLRAEVVREQVQHLRQRGISRLNTTGRSTALTYDRAQPIGPSIEGPLHVDCGTPATWALRAQRLGRYVATYRYRLLHSNAAPGSWREVFEPVLTLTPRKEQSGVEIEATLQDLWAPAGVIKGDDGRRYPHPDNLKASTQTTARFSCTTR